MLPKTVIWDWNGTLLDDVNICASILNILLTRHNYAPVEGIEKYKEIFGFPIEEYYKRAGFDFAKHPYNELAKEYMVLYRQHSEECSLSDGAKSTLQALQKLGVRQVILSASPIDLLHSQLEKYNLEQYFKDVLGLCDIYAKSKAELGCDYIKRSGIDISGAIMVGDSVHDAYTAQQMGIKSVLYCKGHEPKARLQGATDTVIDDLRQILQL